MATIALGPARRPAILGERRLDLAGEVARGDVDDPVPTAATGDRGDRAVGQEAVGGAIEHPGRLRELRVHRRERLEPRAVDEPVEVPPPAPIAYEMQHPVWRPLGLDDRLVQAARRQVRGIEIAVAPDRGDPQAGRVPRHVRVVPLEPGEPGPVRRQTGSGEEVGAFDEDPRRPFAIEGHVDDRRDGLAIAAVILAHGQEPAAPAVEPQVGVAVVTLGRDGLGLRAARVQAVQPAVSPVREDDRATGHRVRAAAVFVDARPDVERRARHVLGRAVGRAPHEDAPAGFGGPALDPVDLVAVDPRLTEPDRIAEQVLDAERRRPAPVRQSRQLVALVVGECPVGGRQRSIVSHRRNSTPFRLGANSSPTGDRGARGRLGQRPRAVKRRLRARCGKDSSGSHCSLWSVAAEPSPWRRL